MWGIDSLPIINNLDITTLYVIHDNEQIWISSPKSLDHHHSPDFMLYRVSNDGPEWETNIYVDVIVEIIDFNTSTKYYLIAWDQLIIKVE